MNHAEKIQRMFDDLSRRGIGSWTFAPPIYRLLWKLGSEIPPPHFSTFSLLFLFQGTFFGLFWGLVVGVALWTWLPLPLWPLLIASVLAGILFGLCMAGYYRWQARTHHLPFWEDYGRAYKRLGEVMEACKVAGVNCVAIRTPWRLFR